MHKVFTSYHHKNDQGYKEALVKFGRQHSIFIDESVDTGGISDSLSDESIREKIRDEYLRDSTVTTVLVGTETKQRKHIDWEIYSSMYDGTVNKKSGILVVTLPTTYNECVHAPRGQSEKNLYPDITSWTSVNSRAEYERLYPTMPDRIIDNLLEPKAKISVVPWDRINTMSLKFLEAVSKIPDRRSGGRRSWAKATIFLFLRPLLVNAAFEDRGRCEYDLSRRMRRANS